MGIEHLLTGGLAALVHPVVGYLTTRQQNHHAERMEEIGIKEFEAEAKAKTTEAAEATRRAVYKGELAAAKASYSLGAPTLPAGLHAPAWAGAVFVLVAAARAAMQPTLLYTTVGLVAHAQLTGNLAALAGTIVGHMCSTTWGWTIGYHALTHADWLPGLAPKPAAAPEPAKPKRTTKRRRAK